MAKLAVCFSMLLVLLMTPTNTFEAMPCCTDYHETRIGFNHLKNYTMQEITDYCNLKAVIFKLLRGKFVCASPEKLWVKKAMDYLDAKL